MSAPDPILRMAAYDPAWPRLFEEEAARLRAALGDLAVRVDHVGSTSVSGLAAKPIVDIQVSVRSLEPFAAYAEPLAALGYGFVPDPIGPDFHFFPRPPEPPRTVHVHVVQSGSDHERRHLAVRDFLRAHPEESRAYAEHKRAVVQQAAGSIDAYIAGKNAFVVELERRALAWWPGG